METSTIKARIIELEQEIDVFKKYESKVPEILQNELDKLKKNYENIEITEQFIPHLQNFLWELKEKFIFQNDYNFSINYGKNKEFKILFDNQIYEASKLEYMELDELQPAHIKVIPAEIEVKSGKTKSYKPRFKSVVAERKEFIIPLIKEGKYTRQVLLKMLDDKFGADDPHGAHPHNNMLSEIKNPKYFAKHGLGGLVEESQNGKYQFAIDYNTKSNKAGGLKPGDQLEFAINNNTKSNESKVRISVTFFDKTVIDYNNVTKTFVEVFEKIGLIKIQRLDIKYGGVPLVADKEYNTYHQKKNVGNFWVITPMSTKQKISCLEKINRRLALRLKIKTF